MMLSALALARALAKAKAKVKAPTKPQEDLLYLCLYLRDLNGEPKRFEDKFNWALITGPAGMETPTTEGKRYHVKVVLEGSGKTARFAWKYDEKDIELGPTSKLLVRVIIGKVKDIGRVETVLRNTPLRAEDPTWNCMVWTGEALTAVLQDTGAFHERVANWQTARDMALYYVIGKIARGRFTKFYPLGDNTKVPTWDGIEYEELWH